MKKNSKIRMCALALAGIMGFTTLPGCDKNVNCDIDELHAHKYVNEYNDSTTYFVCENEMKLNLTVNKITRYSRDDSYILLTEEEEKLLNYLNNKNLLSMEYNSDYIAKFEDSFSDKIEYRYFYSYIDEKTVLLGGEFPSYGTDYTPTIGYTWTTDKNHKNLTGEQREIHCEFYGYDVKKENNNRYVSETKYFDSLEELKTGVDYISWNFYTPIDVSTGKAPDYEDGKEEDHKVSDSILSRYKDELKELEKEERAKILTN